MLPPLSMTVRFRDGVASVQYRQTEPEQMLDEEPVPHTPYVFSHWNRDCELVTIELAALTNTSVARAAAFALENNLDFPDAIRDFLLASHEQHTAYTEYLLHPQPRDTSNDPF
jgi:hypothetical protein